MLLTEKAWLDTANGQDPVPPYFAWRVAAADGPLFVLQLCPASLPATELVRNFTPTSFESLLEVWESLPPKNRVGATVHLMRDGVAERVREIWQYTVPGAATRRFAFVNHRAELIPYWGELPALADKQCLAVIE
ncbi:hypothetical protein LMG31506_05785 [Cupriavidus yeoncheonensis]|uniref:Uncharacterized protein n=1 Tax=Cupriavidus yeoncheonensis TaxID=1462994 RepID=A0A916J0D7_9BURK|nr:hypothetical protein [Cupriavidus yeoncheonensis]CAG2156687.1 hypothetical protein LMG31506_05785 [Cupriavidus yeoncheonensis]